jgi:hypothetical protein
MHIKNANAGTEQCHSTTGTEGVQKAKLYIIQGTITIIIIMVIGEFNKKYYIVTRLSTSKKMWEN